MSTSNIWTAASEGDFARVQQLVDSGLSPSIPDENTYTPLHASASWAHPEILRYLVSKGGNINVTDSDGETPLFVVETAEMARIVVELGGDPNWRNEEGLTAAESLQEDYPHISLYLRSLTSSSSTSSPPPPASAARANPDLDAPTDALLLQVKEIMEASERGELTPDEVDEKLREVVESSVLGQVEAGREIGEMEVEEGEADPTRKREDRNGDDEPGESRKRREIPGR